MQMEKIATFEEEAGGTRVTMHVVFPSADARDQNVRDYGSIEGGRQTLQRLADYLSGSLSGRVSVKVQGGMR